MLAPARHRRILEHLRLHGTVGVTELASALATSESTVRRDLRELDEQGRLTRVHGGASSLDTAEPADTLATAGSAPVSVPAGSVRPPARAEVLDRIGRAAAARVTDGMTVLVLAGSTTQSMLKYLRARDLTVVTNGLTIAGELAHRRDVSTVLLGGMLHAEQLTTYGPLTDQNMGEFHVDLLVAGAWGVHPATGVSGTKVVQAGYHRSMLEHTDALIVLADSSKLGRQGPVLLAATEDIDVLVTDADAEPDAVDTLRARGVDTLTV